MYNFHILATFIYNLQTVLMAVSISMAKHTQHVRHT